LRAIALAVSALLPIAVAAFAPPALASTTPTVTATISVEGFPNAIAVDPGTHTAYVTAYPGGNMSVIDEATNTVTATIPNPTVDAVGSSGAVAVDPGTRTAYVSTVNGTSTPSVARARLRSTRALAPLTSAPSTARCR
jgi:YVTN family beta-propeller protein